MADNESKAIDGITADAVGVLGLTDIILGGLVLYQLHLRSGSTPSVHLPSTGERALDVTLLVCAAAMTGKIVTLVVSAVMAVVNVMLRLSKYDAEIAEASKVYCTATGRPLSTSPRLSVAAIAAVSVDDSSRRKALLQSRTHAVVAYGAAYLAWMYAPVLDAFISARAMRLACFAFIVLGVLQQASTLVDLVAYLQTPPPKKE